MLLRSPRREAHFDRLQRNAVLALEAALLSAVEREALAAARLKLHWDREHLARRAIGLADAVLLQLPTVRVVDEALLQRDLAALLARAQLRDEVLEVVLGRLQGEQRERAPSRLREPDGEGVELDERDELVPAPTRARNGRCARTGARTRARRRTRP